MADPLGGSMPMPPGGPIEIVFSFDTTGSMSSYIAKVRTEVASTIKRLLGDVPFLRIAVFAHGDYCDARTYVTKHIDFTRDLDDLVEFVNDAQGTGGGDWEECYELVLQEVRTKLSWTPGTQRALVMIGDAIPHNVTFYKNGSHNNPGMLGMQGRGKGKGKGKAAKDHEVIDWKQETRRLHEETGLHVYAVQCGSDKKADFFWEHLADKTGGRRLLLDNFDGIIELIMAICYRESGPDVFSAYEREIRDRDGDAIRRDLDAMFTHLRGDTADDTTAATTSLASPSTPSFSFSAPISKARGLCKADSTSSSIIPTRRGRKRTRKLSPVPSEDEDEITKTSSTVSETDLTLFGLSDDENDEGSDEDPEFVPPRSPSPTSIDLDTEHDSSSEHNEESESESDDDYTPTVANKRMLNSGAAVGKMKASVPKTKKVKKAPKDRPEVPRKLTTQGAATLRKFIRSKNENDVRTKRRESNQGSKFVFNNLEWSRWKLAMACKSDASSAKGGKWRQRKGHVGMRNVSLFEEGREEPAVYEIGVQLKGSAINHTVFVRSSGGFDSMSWDTYLLRDLRVRQKIDTILSMGHKMYVRRALLDLPYVGIINEQKVRANSADELRRLMCAVYDYPWIERRTADGKRGARIVKRSGVVISGNHSNFTST